MRRWLQPHRICCVAPRPQCRTAQKDRREFCGISSLPERYHSGWYIADRFEHALEQRISAAGLSRVTPIVRAKSYCNIAINKMGGAGWLDRNVRADVWKATDMFELTLEALLVAVAVITALASGVLFGLYWGGPGRRGAQQGYDGVFRYLQVVAERLRQQLISEPEAARLCRAQFLEYAKLAAGTDLSGNTRIAYSALIAGAICALSLVGSTQFGSSSSAIANQVGAVRIEPSVRTTEAAGDAWAAGNVDRRPAYPSAIGTSQSHPKYFDGPSGSGVAETIARLVERLHRSPHDSKTWRMLGRSHIRAGNYAKAGTSLRARVATQFRITWLSGWSSRGN